LTKRKT